MKWNHGHPLEPETLIDEFERRYGYTFPAEFKAVVKHHNAAYPEVECFYSYRSGRKKRRVFNSLFSFHKTDSPNIWRMNDLDGSDWDTLTNGAIRNYVIFADDPFGNPIAFDKRTNEIVWIDHEEADFSKAVEKAADSFSALLRCWSYDTENPLLSYYASFKFVVFRSPSADEAAALVKLTGGRMPETFRSAFTQTVLDTEPEVNHTEFIPYGIDRVIAENTSRLGERLRQFGLFTFLTADNGDPICFNMNEPDYPVYQFPRGLLGSSGDFEFTADTGSGTQLYRFPFHSENVFRFAPQLAETFDEFISLLLQKDVGIYDASDIVERFEEGDI